MENMNGMNKDVSLPDGVKETKGKYPVGSYVSPNVAHMPGQKGKLAKVLKAVTGTFYIVDFGDGPHKWYAEGELNKEDPLTKDRIKKMSPKEINDNWALVQEVLKNN